MKVHDILEQLKDGKISLKKAKQYLETAEDYIKKPSPKEADQMEDEGDEDTTNTGNSKDLLNNFLNKLEKNIEEIGKKLDWSDEKIEQVERKFYDVGNRFNNVLVTSVKKFFDQVKTTQKSQMDELDPEEMETFNQQVNKSKNIQTFQHEIKEATECVIKGLNGKVSLMPSDSPTLLSAELQIPKD